MEAWTDVEGWQARRHWIMVVGPGRHESIRIPGGQEWRYSIRLCWLAGVEGRQVWRHWIVLGMEALCADGQELRGGRRGGILDHAGGKAWRHSCWWAGEEASYCAGGQK